MFRKSGCVMVVVLIGLMAMTVTASAEQRVGIVFSTGGLARCVESAKAKIISGEIVVIDPTK